MTYTNEEALVDAVISYLERKRTPWGQMGLVREFFYQRGRADLAGVLRSGDIVAFEAKLTRWRKALQQAYRNTCFAHRSYVVLPEKTAHIAVRFCGEFERRRVGLCTVKDGKLVVLHEAPKSQPLQPWLSRQVACQATGE